MRFDIKDFGAVPDGKTLNTVAIQKAIDACAAAGGGSVVVGGGVYLTGTIILRDRIDLHLEADGVLLGSPNCGHYAVPEDKSVYRDFRVGEIADYGDYPDLPKKHVAREKLPRARSSALVFAEEVTDISISGKGVIDANGEHFIEKIPADEHYHQPYGRIYAPTPPRVVFFTGCRNVTVTDVTMRNQPAGWSYWIHDCDFVIFDRVRVLANVEYPNNDGIHINSSRDVTISNSIIQCGDDTLIVRANNISLAENKVCERVTVTNCNLISRGSGIRIAWTNDGVIRNCSFSNLVMTDTTCGVNIFLAPSAWAPHDHGREGTLVENLAFGNITMDRMKYPVKIDIDPDPQVRCAAIRGIHFSGIHARGKNFPVLKGRADCPLDGITFNGCSFVAEKGGDGNFPPMAISDARHVNFNNTVMETASACAPKG